MQRITIIIAILALAFASLACSVNINLPDIDVKTGPTVSEDILVENPDSDSANVVINFGAGELFLTPGSGDSLISGTATYNVADLKPELSTRGSRVEINTGDMEFSGIPSFKGNLKNEWNLQLGSFPMNLTIEAGAYQGEFELGGLSILNLEVTDGAADTTLSFSEANQVEMNSLRYQTGASSVKLIGLANANTRQLLFDGGAGDYTLDFSGELSSDVDVTIKAGVSHVVVIVPKGTAARVIFDGGLSNIDIDGDWVKEGDEYFLAGDGPEITIEVDMGAGSLELRNQ